MGTPDQTCGGYPQTNSVFHFPSSRADGVVVVEPALPILGVEQLHREMWVSVNGWIAGRNHFLSDCFFFDGVLSTAPAMFLGRVGDSPWEAVLCFLVCLDASPFAPRSHIQDRRLPWLTTINYILP